MIQIRSTEGRILLAPLMDFVSVFRKRYIMDAMLIFSLLDYSGTLTAARYHSQRKIF